MHPAPDARIIATDGNRFEDTVDAVAGAILDAQARRAADAAVARPVIGPRASEPDRAHHQPPGRTPTPRPLDDSISPLIWVMTFGARSFCRAITRVSIQGALEELPRTGPLIIASNHASNLDVPVIGSWLIPRLGRRIQWLGKKELFDWPVIGWRPRTVASTPSTVAPRTWKRFG